MIGPNSLIHITPSLFVTHLGGRCHTSRVSDGLTAHLTPAISAPVLKSAAPKRSSLSVFVAGKTLWIVALRREGEEIRALRFLKLGASVMPPALILAARPKGNATAQAVSISVSTPMRPASDGLPERSRVATVL
jgi:hypothetical protein